jgi:hypothetical protein
LNSIVGENNWQESKFARAIEAAWSWAINKNGILTFTEFAGSVDNFSSPPAWAPFSRAFSKAEIASQPRV